MDSMNKRILIAILLSVAVLVAYPFIMPAPKVPQKDISAPQGVEQAAEDKAGKALSAAERIAARNFANSFPAKASSLIPPLPLQGRSLS